MSDVIFEPSSAPQESPPSIQTESLPAGQVILAELDDKHLKQYRHPNEARAVVAIVLGLVAICVVLWVARPILGNLLEFLPAPVLRFISTWVDPSRLGLAVVGLLLLTMVLDIVGQSSRSMQLVAQAVEVTPSTFPQFAPIVDELRTRFDIHQTRVYVSRDAPLTGYTIGVRPPFAIVFSSLGVGSLSTEEFKFCLGREMGSIKLGHTRMAVLMGNVNMSLPQPFSFLLKFRSILFGSYNHAQALSCDRIGVVATRSVTPALSTLIKQNLGQVRGAKIDVKSLAPQTAELNQGISGVALRAAMVFNAQPFALARLAELVAWAGAPESAATVAPAAPSAPTPAASAKAAAASANAAAASAQAAAESAKAAIAALALLMPSGAGGPSIITASPAAADTAPATLSDLAAVPAAAGTTPETSPATEAVAVSVPASESTGAGASAPPLLTPDGGVVGVTTS